MLTWILPATICTLTTCCIFQINTANGSIIFVPAPTVGTGLSSALAKSPNPSKNDNPTSQTEVKAKAVKEDSAEDKNGIGTQCSGIATFFYLLFFSSQGAGDPNQLDANLVGLDMTKWHAQLSPIILWVGVAISAFFLSSSVLLWRGIRRERRRHLLPWLLLTGVTLLMLITAAVWLVITGKAGSHLGGRAAAAGPAAAALLLLYWWLLVNDLLEELHRDKKAKAEFVVSEKIAMTTAAAAAMAAAAGIAPKRSSSGGAECNDLAETRRENTLVWVRHLDNIKREELWDFHNSCDMAYFFYYDVHFMRENFLCQSHTTVYFIRTVYTYHIPLIWDWYTIFQSI